VDGIFGCGPVYACAMICVIWGWFVTLPSFTMQCHMNLKSERDNFTYVLWSACEVNMMFTHSQTHPKYCVNFWVVLRRMVFNS
jgi:hypothetical protein